jgi:hypothetical protein
MTEEHIEKIGIKVKGQIWSGEESSPDSFGNPRSRI